MILINATLKTIFFYFFVVFGYRIMGKREIGELGIIDLIVSILIANIVAISIENLDRSILETIIPIIVLIILEVLLAYLSCKNKNIRYLFSGKPSMIISKGKINYQEMVKQRYTLDDLLLELRNNSIKTIKDVDYAVLESNGKLSIFQSSKNHDYPMPLIMDGCINPDTLKAIRKDESWLNKKLNQDNIKLKNIFYAFYYQKQLYIIKKDDFLS